MQSFLAINLYQGFWYKQELDTETSYMQFKEHN